MARRFSPEFRNQVVHAVIDSSRTVAEVAREYNLVAQTVGNWVNEARRAQLGDTEAAEGKVTETELTELARLRRENRELKAEKEFLGKAAAFFAKEYR